MTTNSVNSQDVTPKKVKIKNNTRIVIDATVIDYSIGRAGRHYLVQIGDHSYYIGQDQLESAATKVKSKDKQ